MIVIEIQASVTDGNRTGRVVFEDGIAVMADAAFSQLVGRSLKDAKEYCTGQGWTIRTENSRLKNG